LASREKCVGVFWGTVGGIGGLVVGFVATAIVSYFVMGALGVSDFEGERGMTSAFALGPLGGLAGLALGVWLALTIRRARLR
jgi:hypothetical protein